MYPSIINENGSIQEDNQQRQKISLAHKMTSQFFFSRVFVFVPSYEDSKPNQFQGDKKNQVLRSVKEVVMFSGIFWPSFSGSNFCTAMGKKLNF